jgi:cation diffusion facilitator CzcD-associated flavoprotein CzcO
MTEDVNGSLGETAVGAVVIGAGFGGLRMLRELRTLNIDAVVLERGSDVGGTWFWNRYPGARTDTESWAYCYSFSDELQQEWNWLERYPSQPEVLAYLRHVTDRFNLRRDIRFGTQVRSSIYDESSNQWVVETDTGERLLCRYLIFATGPLSKPIAPSFPGLETFAGEWYLTARWPEQPVSFAGKRVAVIGTGSTGIQVVPEVAKQAAHVMVFQRTPNYAIPGRNRALTDEERRGIKDRYPEFWALTQRQASGFPIRETRKTFAELDMDEQRDALARAFERGGFEFLFTTFRDLMVNEEANEAAAEFLRAYIRSVVNDPATAELLCPKGYPFGAKRPAIEHGYYEAFNRPNVTLVDVRDDPIAAITTRGVRTSTAERDFDMLIFATGFDSATGELMAMDICGRGSRSLRDAWANGPRTFLGMTVDGFPNMFLISGPQSPFGNIPVMIENEVRWIGAAIEHGVRHEVATLEPGPTEVQEWVDEVDRSLNATLMRKGTLVHSWSLGLNVDGKPTAPLFYFGRANKYFDRLAAVVQHRFAEITKAAHVANATETTGMTSSG